MPERDDRNVAAAELLLEAAASAEEGQAMVDSTRAIGYALLALLERIDEIGPILQDLTRGGLA